MTLKFYQTPMSSSSPIVWIMAELGVDHESITVDLKGGAQKKPEFLALNPMGQVPTLVRDGHAMFESSAITVFLGETYGVERDLWPAVGSDEHMVALTWTSWIAATAGRTLHQIMANSHEMNDPETFNDKQLALGKERFAELMNVIDGHLDGRQYITGDRFTLVDCYAAAMLGWSTQTVGFDPSSTPNLGGWLARCLAREAAKAMGVPL